MYYHICANCRTREKDKSFSHPKGWRSRAVNQAIVLLCPACQVKCIHGVIS